MNSVFLTALVAIGLAVGWRGDAWLSAQPDQSTSGPTPAPQSQGTRPAKASDDPLADYPLTEIRSLADLQALEVAGLPRLSEALQQRAIEHASAEQLANVARDFYEKNLPDAWEDSEPLRSIMRQWAKVEPRAALAFCETHNLWNADGVCQRAILEIFKTNREEAVQHLTKFCLDSGSRFPFLEARGDCLTELEKSPIEPQEALQFILDLDARTASERMMPSAMGNFADTWVERAPAEALSWILHQPPSFSRSIIIPDMFSAWARKDYAAAREFFNAVSHDLLPIGELRWGTVVAMAKAGDEEEQPSK